MKVLCRFTKAKDLKDYESKSLSKGEFGRFGASTDSEYSIEEGREYIVMGMVLFQNYLAYLIDDLGFILTAPTYLFVVIDPEIPPHWYYRQIEKEENIYPFIQAIWGYKEFCFDKQSYEDLIVEKTEEAQQIYFRRKIAFLDTLITD